MCGFCKCLPFSVSLKEIFYKHFGNHTINDEHCMPLGMERKLSQIENPTKTQHIIGAAPINFFRCHQYSNFLNEK